MNDAKEDLLYIFSDHSSGHYSFRLEISSLVWHLLLSGVVYVHACTCIVSSAVWLPSLGFGDKLKFAV